MPGPTLAAQCCAVLQLVVLYAVLEAAARLDNCAPFSPLSFASSTICGVRGNGQPSQAPFASSPIDPDGRPPIRNPAPPVGMVHRPPRSVAITTCPATISSLRSPGEGPLGPRQSNVLRCLSTSFKFLQQTGRNGCNAIRRQWPFGSTELN